MLSRGHVSTPLRPNPETAAAVVLGTALRARAMPVAGCRGTRAKQPGPPSPRCGGRVWIEAQLLARLGNLLDRATCPFPPLAP